jgi:hypothetical protein
MKHLSRPESDSVLDIIRTWNGKLTWAALLKQIRPKMGSFTRQALGRHAAIQRAYSERKRILADQRSHDRPGHDGMSAEMRAALATVERLDAQNKRQALALAELNEKFVRWNYNATRRGMTEEQLDQPMPAVPRSQTDETKLFAIQQKLNAPQPELSAKA